jgi:hypothetical protein
MEVVTNRENILRGVGPSASNARKKKCAHGHLFTEENTRVFMKSGTQRRECKKCRSASNKRHHTKRKARAEVEGLKE